MEKLRGDEYAKALEAEKSGTITDDQRLLINQENLRFEQQRIDREKKEKGVWRRLKETAVGTETYEEPKGGKLGLGRRKGTDSDLEKGGVTEAVGDMLAQRDEKFKLAEEKVDSFVKSGTGHQAGGPLDQLAQQTTESVSRSTKSWTGWLTGR
jgi:hypothetical protein